MIHMPHNTDNRRTLYHILFVLFLFPEKLFDHIHFYFLLADDFIFDSNFFRRFKADFLVDRNDLAL